LREGVPWRFIGPYLSERQWGTVREDDIDTGDAWSYLSHDHRELAELRPMAKAYRRVTGDSMPPISTAREARGVHE